MSMLSDLFKPKSSTVTQEPMMPDWQLKTGQQLSEWIQKYMNQYVPGEAYGGQFTAGTTPYEKQSLNRLSGLLDSPATGDLFTAGKLQLMNTLGGQYADPNKSPFIQAMTKMSRSNLGDMIDQIRAKRGGRGTFYTKEGIQEEGRTAESVAENLDALIGQFIEGERGRMFSAAPQAQAMDQYENLTAPLAKIEAGQTYGSLDRIIEQADLEKQYEDFIRQRTEMGEPIGAAQSLYGTSVPYGIKSLTTKRPSTFMSMLGEISPAVGSYNTQKYGYDVNQASLSDAMKDIMKIIQAGGGIMN